MILRKILIYKPLVGWPSGYGARLRLKSLTFTFLVPKGSWVRIPLQSKKIIFAYLLVVSFSALPWLKTASREIFVFKLPLIDIMCDRS